MLEKWKIDCYIKDNLAFPYPVDKYGEKGGQPFELLLKRRQKSPKMDSSIRQTTFHSDKGMTYFSIKPKIIHIKQRKNRFLTRIRGGEPYQAEVFDRMFESGSGGCPVQRRVCRYGMGVPSGRCWSGHHISFPMDNG